MKQHAALELHPAKKRRKEAKAFKTHRKEKKKDKKKSKETPDHDNSDDNNGVESENNNHSLPYRQSQFAPVTTMIAPIKTEPEADRKKKENERPPTCINPLISGRRGSRSLRFGRNRDQGNVRSSLGSGVSRYGLRAQVGNDFFELSDATLEHLVLPLEHLALGGVEGSIMRARDPSRALARAISARRGTGSPGNGSGSVVGTISRQPVGASAA
jgi:hypothetical protein